MKGVIELDIQTKVYLFILFELLDCTHMVCMTSDKYMLEKYSFKNLKAPWSRPWIHMFGLKEPVF